MKRRDSAVNECLRLVDPSPGPCHSAVCPADHDRSDGLPGLGDSELSGHRVAHDHHRRQSGGGGPDPVGDRGRAQDRGQGREPGRHRAHPYHPDRRFRDHPRRVPDRQGLRGRLERGPQRRGQRARRPAPGHDRPGGLQGHHLGRPDRHLHRRPPIGWTSRPCPGSSTTRSPRRSWRSRGSAGWRGSAAWTGRSMWTWTAPGCRRSASPPGTSRRNSSASSRTPPAGAGTSAGPCSRCAAWARWTAWPGLRRWISRWPTGGACAWATWGR